MWALVTQLPPEAALMRALAQDPPVKRPTTDPREIASFFGEIFQTA